MKLMTSSYHRIERDGVLATRLCTHKDDVELTNEDKLQQLPGLNLHKCSYNCRAGDVFDPPLGGVTSLKKSSARS